MASVAMYHLGFGTGTPFPPEVILLVIENMEYEPGMLETLMCVSRQLRNLIKEHEASLSTHFARPYNPVFNRLYTSGLGRRISILRPRTLPWIAECYLRNKVLQDLLNDGFHSKMHVNYRDAYFCKQCFKKAVGEKGFIGLDVLYQVFDASHGEIGRRESQMGCISDLSPPRIAHLRLLLNVLGAVYAKKIVMAADFENPTDYNVRLNDVSCIVREMVLRHGPYFIWAGLHGTAAEQVSVKRCINDGIAQYRVYENSDPVVASVGVNNNSGNPFIINGTRYSLQNWIIVEFCRKVKCTRDRFWEKLVSTAVDDFVVKYKDTVHVVAVAANKPT